MKKNNQNKLPLVVLLGRPNSGKSTLINSLLNQKVTITSPKPQTTRKNSVFTFNSPQGSFNIVDTPGILDKVVDTLGRSVNKQAPTAINNASLILYLVDISRSWGEEEQKSLALVRLANAKKVLVYNKIDQAIGTKNFLAQYNFMEQEFDATISISALKSTHLKSLVNLIFSLLPPQDPKTFLQVSSPLLETNSLEFISELIREKTLLTLRKEVPYTVNVVVNSVEHDPDKNIINIYADIETTDPRYKKMIIGRGGYMIKKIGIMARKELELMSNKHVFLKLQVIVNKHWQELYL